MKGPQGGVISPMLSHVVLHEWFEQEIKPRLKGRSFLVRLAEDFVIGCELESDARGVMDALPKRFDRYGLTIHPTKTKLIEFGRPDGDHFGITGNYKMLDVYLRHTKGAWKYWLGRRHRSGPIA